jgi:NhaC family Na+:H+ antiporter
MNPVKDSFLSSVIALIISLGTLVYGVTILGQNPHVPLLFSCFVLMIYGLLIGKKWQDMMGSIVKSISDSIEIMIIICLIGIMVGVLVASGAVPSIIYYGLQFLSPTFFLPFVLIICSIMSVCTGSAWTTVGTIGIVFIGISEALDIPIEITAGAILCGAFFGDKQSPVSDTTNYAAGVAKTSLYDHTRSMLYTTVPAQLIALVLFTMIGWKRSKTAIDVNQINLMTNGIKNHMTVSVWLILLLVFMMVLIIKKVPAVLTIIFTICLAVLCMVLVQGISLEDSFTIMYSGNVGNTGIEEVDRLLTRGGMTSMFSTVALMLMSLMLAGLMQSTDVLKHILDKLHNITRSDFGLVTITLISVIILSFIASDPYLAMLIPANLFGEEYDKHHLDRSVLSRTLEDGGTIVCPMVPWGTSGLYCSSTLGVSVAAYLPYYFIGFLDPVIAVIAAATGWGMFSTRPPKDRSGKNGYHGRS